MALGTLPPERVKNASGLFNFTRNLGGAVGLAALTTILNNRTDLHLARLHERLTYASRPAVETLENLTTQLHSFGSDAADMALKQLMQMTHTQWLVMAFADVFYLLSLAVFGACSPSRGGEKASRAALARLSGVAIVLDNPREKKLSPAGVSTLVI